MALKYMQATTIAVVSTVGVKFNSSACAWLVVRSYIAMCLLKPSNPKYRSDKKIADTLKTATCSDARSRPTE